MSRSRQILIVAVACFLVDPFVTPGFGKDGELPPGAEHGRGGRANTDDEQAVADEGLKDLKDLARLEFLVLSGTRVTDEGLPHLRGLTKLCHLWLVHTRVSVAGLKQLRDLPALSLLGLSDWRIGYDDRRELQRIFPHVEQFIEPEVEPGIE